MAAPDLERRIILVTGASRGLGRALAFAAAGAGAQVIATARTRGGLEELDDAIREKGGSATLLPLDLRKGDEVDRLGPSIYQRFGRLDGLCHCAAELGVLTPVAELDPKVLARNAELHIAATQRLIRTTHPLLAAAPAGRAVFVSDAEALAHRPFFAAYAATKAAMEALVLAHAGEVARTSIRVNLFVPPPMATKLRRDAYPGEARDAQPDPAIIAPALLPLLTAAETRHGERIVASVEG